MENTESKTQLSILIIEDHPDQRDLLGIVLQREGYKVVTAANGVEALERLEQEEVHIALSDIMMPKMDGFELINRIRSNSALRHIYIDYCSHSGGRPCAWA
jgi:CheY-like chemotaxis protein